MASVSAARSRKKTCIIICVLVLLIGICLAIGIPALVNATKQVTETPTTASPSTTNPPLPTAPPETPFLHGAVAADSGPCSELGRDMMKRNGSAVDAAVAAMFCVGVLNLHSTGIGGGGFLLVYQKSTGKSEAFDFRETAPANATRDMFVNKTKDTRQLGGLATGVPGQVMGLYQAHQKYGRLPWKELVQPAIDMAENGFQLSIPASKALSGSKTRRNVFKDPGLRKLLFNSETDPDKVKKAGSVIKDIQLAETLKIIRDDPYSFYNGSLARKVANDIQSAGGIVSEEDLRNYAVRMKTPLNSTLSQHYVLSVPPPSSGAVIAMIMNILNGYNMKPSDRNNHTHAPLTFHRMVESFKFAYAWRAMLGDEDKENVTETVNTMMNETYCEILRQMINDSHTYNNASHYGGYYVSGENHGTAHMSVLSPDGDAVSFTSTINFYFGAKYRSLETGIIYNNEMDDFSTPGIPNGFNVDPSPTNFIKPGKRPMSSMSPVIVIDKKGDVKLVIGASGGTRITTGTAQVMMSTLWFQRNASLAVEEPRLHHQLLPNEVVYYSKMPYNMPMYILNGLTARGHILKKRTSSSLCNAMAISKEKDGKIYAKSDPRKSAWAAGY